MHNKKLWIIPVSVFSILAIFSFAQAVPNFTTGLNVSGGSVGIGNVSPSYKLDLSGGIIRQSGYLVADAASNNLVANGDFELGGAYGWSSGTVVSGGYSGQYALQVAGNTQLTGDDFIPVDPTKDIFQLEAWVKKSAAGSTPGVLYFGYIAYDANKSGIYTSPCGTYCYFATSGWVIPVDGNWHKISATTVGEGTSYPNFPVGTKYVKIMGLMNYSGSGDAVTLLDHVTLKRITKGPLIAGNYYTGTNWVDQNQYSTIYTNSSDQLIISSPGNVGINKTPTSALDVNGTITATAFTGTVAGSVNASNVSAGAFAANTGGGNFSFPGNAIVNAGSSSWSEGLSIDSANGIWGGLKFRTTGRSGNIGNWHLGYSDTHSTEANSNLYLYSGAGYYLTTWTQTGNVGIGTTAPEAPLNLYKTPTGGFVEQLRIGGTGNYRSLDLGTYGAYGGYISTYGNDLYILSGRGVASENHNIHFYTSFIGAGGEAENNERMTILYNGNVGIGTAAPGYKLDVSGSSQFAGPITLTDATYFLGSPSHGFRFNDHASNYNNFIIYENGNTYTRGSVGIGTTAPGAKLEVNGGIKISTTPGGDMWGSGVIFKDETTSTWWQIHFHGDRLRSYNGSTELVYLTSGDSVSYAASAGSATNAGYATTAGSVSGLTLTSSANGINPDSVSQNQIGYNNSVSLFGQSDGGLYSSAYSSAWIHQIYGDFRTGQIAIRGKNGGAWQAWRTVIDSGNIGSQSVNYASSAGNADTVDSLHQTDFLRISPSSSNPYNGNFAIGNASSRNFIQSHAGQPLDINPLGNAVTINNATPITSSNIGSQSVNYAASAGSASSAGNADTTDGYHVSTGGAANTIPTRNGSGYLSPANWTQLDGYYGLYSGYNGAHFYPNPNSYGSWMSIGTRNGYGGIEFSAGAGNITLMIGQEGWGGMTTGMHANSYGWLWRFVHDRLYAGGATLTGDVTASAFNYSSDLTLKKNILTISNPIDKIMQLRGVTFNWKKDDTASVGVIAQEVEKVFPELVSESDGKKTVQYGNLVAPLIEAVKAQQEEIEDLKAQQINSDKAQQEQINILRARLKALEVNND